MNVAERYTIAYKGLKNGLHEFDFEVGAALFEAYESTEIKGGACEVHVSLNRETYARTAYDDRRCGNGVLRPLSGGLRRSGAFRRRSDGEVLGRDRRVRRRGDVDLPSAGELDLTQYIYESIVPRYPISVHPEGGCDPEMLARFHIVSGAEFAAIEARADGNPAGRSVPESEWGKLEALREQLTREVGEAVRTDGSNHDGRK